MATSLYIHATIVTLDNTRRIYVDGALLVHGNRIAAVDETEALLQSSSVRPDTTIIDCANCIIIPGLINTHAHLAQSLLRGLAEDLPLRSWLCDAVWPLEANYESQDGYVAARLTIAEMLRSGTTCFLEAMLTHRSGFANVSRAVEELGIRACLGKLVKVEETNKEIGMLDPRDRDVDSMSIGSALAAHDKYHGSCDAKLHVWIAASTPRGSPASAHKAIGDASASHGINLTMHCAEAPKDLDIFRHSYGQSPAEFCVGNNLIGKGRNTVLAHMVNLDLARDLPLLQEHQANIAHNPASNCKLASGIAAVPEMVANGINVALGTDGAPCNNTYDMLQEMRLAGLIHKGNMRDATVLSAEQVLEMATINAAKALGLDHEIGSIETGKKADFVVLDASGSHCGPFDTAQITSGGLDPITTVVYSCTGADVRTVVVDGQILVKDRKLLSADEHEVLEQARSVVSRLRQVSGVKTKVARNYV